MEREKLVESDVVTKTTGGLVELIERVVMGDGSACDRRELETRLDTIRDLIEQAPHRGGGYRYLDHRQKMFTDEGQRLLLDVRDATFDLLETSGAAKVEAIIDEAAGTLGAVDSWEVLTCVDRLIEIGDLKVLRGGDGKFVTRGRR